MKLKIQMEYNSTLTHIELMFRLGFMLLRGCFAEHNPEVVMLTLEYQIILTPIVNFWIFFNPPLLFYPPPSPQNSEEFEKDSRFLDELSKMFNSFETST